MIRVLVLDPHPLIHAGFEQIIAPFRHFHLLPPKYKYKQLEAVLQKEVVDLLIMELDLLEASPVDIIAKVTVAHPRTKIIVFTHHSVKVFANSILKAGALGYLSKRTPSKLLLEAMLYVYNKGENIVSKHDNELDYNIDIKRPRNNYGKLSPREIQILKHLIDGKKNVVIANELRLSQKTINTYKTRIMNKLDTKNFYELYSQTKLHLPL